MSAPLFYLQDSRSYVGNDVLWWAKAGNGYTTDLSKAQVFTKDEAQQHHDARSTDIPWPKDYIDGKTRPAVDMQYLKRDEALDVTQWEPLDDLIGLQTQISNMTTGIGDQLAAALAACEGRAKALRWYMLMMSIEHQYRINDILTIKPDASALKAHDEALIEKIAQRMADSGIGGKYIAEAIRELKGML